MVVEQAGGQLVQILWYVILAVGGAVFAFLAGFIGVLLYRLLKYNYEVNIYEHGGGNLIRKDLGFVERRSGRLRLLRTKLKERDGLPLPSADKIFSRVTKFGIKRVIDFHETQGILTPMGVVRNSPVAHRFDMDDLIGVLRWREQDHQEALDTYRDKMSFWERNQTVLALGAFMMVFIVFAFIMVWKLQNLNIVVDMSQQIR